jgi:hypothetical protein
MAIEVNKRLPQEKRLPLIEFRYIGSELRRLHEESFPTSTLRTTTSVLAAVSTILVAAGVVVEIAK